MLGGTGGGAPERPFVGAVLPPVIGIASEYDNARRATPAGDVSWARTPSTGAARFAEPDDAAGEELSDNTDRGVSGSDSVCDRAVSTTRLSSDAARTGADGASATNPSTGRRRPGSGTEAWPGMSRSWQPGAS